MSGEQGETTCLFEPQEVLRDTIARVTRAYEHLTEQLFFLLPGITPPPTYLAYSSGPLREHVLDLVRVANGEVDLDHLSETDLYLLQDTIQHVVETLCVPPWGPEGYTIPETFWRIPIGRVIQYVRLLQRGEDLIDYTTAARLLYASEELQQHVAVKRVARLVEDGTLEGYANPRVTNPKHARRVSRQQVLALLEQQGVSSTVEIGGEEEAPAERRRER